MAGWAAYNKLNQFVMLPMQTMAMAATTFVSQNMGAQNYKRANQGTRTSLIFTEGITFTIVTTVVLLSRQAAGLFTNDSQVVDIASIFIRQNMYFLLFNCINHVLAGALRGRGDSRGPMIIMLISFVAIRQVYLFIMSRFNSFLAHSYHYREGEILYARCENR